MRKIVTLNRISLDGFFAGPNGEIDWFVPDPQVDRAAHEMMHPDTLLMGRVTYQMFASYWPHVGADPKAPQGARATAQELRQMNKVVFSKTLGQATWENSRLVKGDLIGTVKELKQGQGADITMFGSGTIVQQLADAGLIDEHLIIVTPVVLGTGKPLFKDVRKHTLELLSAKNFDSGNVMLHYRVG